MALHMVQQATGHREKTPRAPTASCAFIRCNLARFTYLTYIIGCLLGVGTTAVFAQATGAQAVGTQSASTLLATLPDTAQEEIKRLCLPVQFSDGAAAYRACVTQDVARRQAAYDDPALAAFDALSFDDKFAIQQLCPSSSDPAAYQNCLQEQISRLNAGESLSAPPTRTIVAAALPSADLAPEPVNSTPVAATSDATTGAPDSTVANVSESTPPVTTQVSTRATTSATDVATTEITAQTNESDILLTNQSATQATSQSISQAASESTTQDNAQESLTDEFELAPLATIVATNPIAETTATDTTSATLVSRVGTEEQTGVNAAQTDNTTASTTRVISSPQFDAVVQPETAETAETADETISATTPAVTTPSNPAVITNQSGNQVDDSAPPATSFLDQFGNLQPEQLKTGLLYAVPVLLLLLLAGLVSVFRKKRADQNLASFASEQSPLASDNHYNDQRFDQFDDTDALKLDLGEDTVDDSLQRGLSDAVAGHSTVDQSIQINLDELPAQGEDNGAINDITATLGDLDTNLIETGVMIDPESRTLGSWLLQFPIDQQKEYVIEYLLYWISYGEGNYDPTMKAELLQARELSDHDQIKRWVLLQDGESFTDALKFCQTTFDSTEIEQIINLVFAVLVKHEASPVQTIFLRFFADINGIGATSLGLRYERAFGKQLPAMPRPDNIRWWDRLAEETKQHHAPDHAHTERDQNLEILGLVDPVSDKAVISTFEQITDRFDPELFDQLGEKERALVARHRDHYTQAYRSLTGETA